MTTDKARDLAEQIESSVNALATETDEVRKSDFFKQWLDAMATKKFSNTASTAIPPEAASSFAPASLPRRKPGSYSMKFHTKNCIGVPIEKKPKPNPAANAN